MLFSFSPSTSPFACMETVLQFRVFVSDRRCRADGGFQEEPASLLPATSFVANISCSVSRPIAPVSLLPVDTWFRCDRNILT